MALFAVPLVYAGSALEHASTQNQPQPLGPSFQALSSDDADFGKGLASSLLNSGIELGLKNSDRSD